MTKDEDINLVIEGLREILNEEELLESMSNNLFIQTGLTYSDMIYLVDIYVLEEGRKNGEQVSRISYKDQK
jgi:hypothetical protein